MFNPGLKKRSCKYGGKKKTAAGTGLFHPGSELHPNADRKDEYISGFCP
jgi:hypothetical protein